MEGSSYESKITSWNYSDNSVKCNGRWLRSSNSSTTTTTTTTTTATISTSYNPDPDYTTRTGANG